jgi:hypothetical protein
VPIGTEPILSVPQLGALGRQYGFSAGMSTKPTGMAPSPSRNLKFTPATARGKPFSSSMSQLSIFMNHHYIAASSSGHNSHIKTQLRASSNNANIDPTLLHTVQAPVKALQHPVAITPANDREVIGEDGDDSDSSAANMDNSKLALLRV